ncbi:MAG: glycosyltransferase [bacterium]
MLDFIVLTNGYPSETKLYNNAFIHSRVKMYSDLGYNGCVIVIGKINQSHSYIFEGVTVKELTQKDAEKFLDSNRNAKIFIHFINKKILDCLLAVNIHTNIFVWIHGVEALSWKRRLFNYKFGLISTLKFLKYIFINVMQMKFMKKLLRINLEIHYIFVSEWMKNILEIDTNSKIPNTKYSIIPNVVDEKLFIFKVKDVNLRYKILSIRTYSNKKYANDITIDIILELSKKEYFNQLEFHLYGDGALFDKLTNKIKHFHNVSINKTFLTTNQIIEAHSKNGIFLCPTRQDAQGVSMCEAMASGLVPITSNNTAIPEFVNIKSLLCDSMSEYISAFEELILNPEFFAECSMQVSKYINKKCGSHVISNELDIIKFKGVL